MAAQPLFFVWKEAFELGLPSIDAEHRQFFEIMNRCARSASAGASPHEVLLLLKELSTYAEFHFRHEEAAMERVGFPELEQQRAEHATFRQELERIQALDAPSALAALSLARDWLVDHVLGTDRKYVAWIERDLRGLSSAS